MSINLRVKLGPLRLKNPIILASGTAGYGQELRPLLDINKLGGIITKTITLKPRWGNPPPRLVEVSAGVVNSIGLENPGLDKFCQDYLPYLKKLKTVRIVSIGGETPTEFPILARELDRQKGIDALEVNISCPNIKHGGGLVAQSPRAIQVVVKSTRKATHLPLIVKLSPAVTDIGAIARVALSSGADIISLINTIPALVVDWKKRRTLLGQGTGGLSGPCIKPIALRMVWEVGQATKAKAPIIGLGGIMTGQDVLEFMVTGASAVAPGTANLIDPTASLRILSETRDLLRQQKIHSIASLVGSLSPRHTTPLTR